VNQGLQDPQKTFSIIPKMKKVRVTVLTVIHLSRRNSEEGKGNGKIAVGSISTSIDALLVKQRSKKPVFTKRENKGRIWGRGKGLRPTS